jgi:2-C-methyl-D-erythritol 2,4-cyclodiphosphate synthase
MRVGFGIDIHPYKKGRSLCLGGVKIPYAKGLQGHSDADVLIHAIMDALLGAASLGDIGIHFPSHPKYRNISSLLLLKKVKTLLKKKRYKIQNIDSTLLMEAPKVAPYIPRMQKNIAAILDLSLNQVSIKATRSEGLGFVGRVEGIAACAICMIK